MGKKVKLYDKIFSELERLWSRIDYIQVFGDRLVGIEISYLWDGEEGEHLHQVAVPINEICDKYGITREELIKITDKKKKIQRMHRITAFNRLMIKWVVRPLVNFWDWLRNV